MIELDDVFVDKTLAQKQVKNPRHMKSMRIGAGDSIFGVDTQGLWLGAKNYKDAPFKVSMAGELTGLVLNSPTINGGIITGALFRTAEEGLRVEIDSDIQNELRFYGEDPGGNDIVYGLLEVFNEGYDGYIRLGRPDGSAGVSIDAALTINDFSSINMFSYGGSHWSNANLSLGGAAGMSNSSGSMSVRLEFNSSDGSGGWMYEQLILEGLPDSDPAITYPGVDNIVWRDGNDLKIT